MNKWVEEEGNQVEIPPSFIELYRVAANGKFSETRQYVAERYEMCEDMAQMLTLTAREMQYSLGVTENDVLIKTWEGLTVNDAIFETHEAKWIIRRLAELLDWRALQGI